MTAPARHTPRRGALLVNLGTPAAPEPGAVRRYLREFLGDPRVLTMPALLRFLLLELVILPRRPQKAAAAYAKIWTPEGSPLLVHSLALEAGVRERLGQTHQVELAMRYGQPGVDAALARFAANDVRDIVVVPLFPQYSEAATGSAIAHVEARAAKQPDPPRLRFIRDFHADPGFIRAFVENARADLEAFRPDHLLLSYHGLPEAQLEAQGIGCFSDAACCESDERVRAGCYRAQCFATSRALIEAMPEAADTHTVCFQSRLGRKPWIKPYTDVVIADLARAGVRRLAVMCPAFTADCLETVEEIGMRLDADWRALGGEALHLCPCPNGSPLFAEAVADMVLRHTEQAASA